MKLWTWNRVDAAVGRLAAWPIRLLVTVTGLQPVAFAYMLTGLAIGIDVDWSIHHLGFDGILGLIIDPLVAVWMLWRFIPQFEQGMGQMEDREVLPTVLHQYRFLGWWRPCGLFLVMADLLPSTSHFLVESLCWFFCYYAVTFYGPRRKVWYLALRDALSLRLAPVQQ